MKFGVVVFPGSNRDHDAWYAVSKILGQEAEFIWHDSTNLGNVDAVILPGGFSYGDYLRCGAIAKFSPVMRRVRRFAADGGLVLGICNGFQILVEAGLLPGALVRNRDAQIHLPRSARCAWRPRTRRSPRSRQGAASCACRSRTAKVATSPISARSMHWKRKTAWSLRYLDNPNGSLRDIAGILQRRAQRHGHDAASRARHRASDGLERWHW